MLNRNEKCAVDGCVKPIGKYGALGMCHAHYQKTAFDKKKAESGLVCACGCNESVSPGRKFVTGHHSKMAEFRANASSRSLRDSEWSARGYLIKTVSTGKKQPIHRFLAEKALGKPLPHGAEVHHVDGNKENNLAGNLVICPSRAYHRALHQRQSALDACGNANWLKCWICQKYDSPENLYVRNNRGRHRGCHIAHLKSLKEGK